MIAKHTTTTEHKIKDIEMFKIRKLIQDQRLYFESGATRNINFRIEQLKKLRRAIKNRNDEILEALHKDLHKPAFEAYISEMAFIYEELDLAIGKTRSWARSRRAGTPWVLQPASSRIVPEPYGVTLIIAPWNYPFQLAMAPLIPAIAAGNTAIVKPSNQAPATARVMADLIRDTFDKEYIAAVEGGHEAGEFLLDQHFDYIFFTGGTTVGRKVMEAAAKNLTPVTLELGGKSPVIVDRDADLDDTARKIVWGKFFNAGQTCLAPDYLLVHSEVKVRLLENLKKVLHDHYGDKPEKSPDYGRIINRSHFLRLYHLMKSGRTVTGGKTHEGNLYIAPTILDSVTLKDPVMQEEIFGPLLPVMEFKDIDEAVSLVNKMPKPLGLYLFTKNRNTEKKILESVPAGGVSINDVMLHVGNYHLPFGGIGGSGMGSYHGIWGFNSFSHLKGVFKRKMSLDLLFRYPPYRVPLKWLRRIFG
ncbi:MAG: aldehyde dehydrogenase family protein [Spirochaetae bacterium HGW-Spirochaetae-1]|jgi:aldehyde dehydrogenase (NAD+)/aldehyde dehydrogenase (NAD(P)+)|nr:MAG: aldehyde dehydrogenase family protein [Spirochaetae bacterium HGW-Spirochaetae-1]